MSVTLDSGALIVGLQATSKSQNSDAVERHQQQRDLLLPYLDLHTYPFIIPAVAFAEFLFGIPDEYKAVALALGANERFKIAPLTARGAIFASQIRMQLIDKEAQDKVCASYGQDKKSFLADIYILAIHKAEGAKKLITRDRPLADKAKRLGINCIHIDDISPSDIFHPKYKDQ
jgi:hypothetical protein